MKRYVVIIFFISFVNNQIYAHGENLARIYAHAIISHDFTNHINRYGLEVNAYAIFLNGAVKYEYGAYDFDSKHIGGFYAGIGIFNFIQFQVGYSTNKYYSLRLKSVWALDDFDINDLEDWSFGVNIEKGISNKQYGWFFSIGIGYRISSL